MTDRNLRTRPELADLLRRFQRPRTYAGDYEADFSDRILDLLGYSEPTALRGIVIRLRRGWVPVADQWTHPQQEPEPLTPVEHAALWRDVLEARAEVLATCPKGDSGGK